MKPTPEEERGMEIFGQNLFMAAKDANEGEEWEIVTNTGTVYAYKGTRGQCGIIRQSVWRCTEEKESKACH